MANEIQSGQKAANTSGPAPGRVQGKEGLEHSLGDFMANDFPYLRKAATIFALVLLSGAIMVGSGKYLLKKDLKTMSEAQAQLDGINSQLNQTMEDIRTVTTTEAEFLRLRERGFVGEENRLGWLELIKKTQQDLRLFPISYDFFPQQTVRLPPDIQAGDMELRGSKMKLSMNLLHEGDIFALIRAMKKTGLNAWQDCRLSRNNLPAEGQISPNLAAECSLYWFTIDRRADSAEQQPQ